MLNIIHRQKMLFSFFFHTAHEILVLALLIYSVMFHGRLLADNFMLLKVPLSTLQPGSSSDFTDPLSRIHKGRNWGLRPILLASFGLLPALSTCVTKGLWKKVGFHPRGSSNCPSGSDVSTLEDRTTHCIVWRPV